MEEIPPLKPKEQEILNELALIINHVKNDLTSRTIYKDSLNIKQTLLLAMFGAVNSYTEAIFELCKQSRPAPAKVILRSIAEAWINAMYIFGYPTDRLVWLFSIEESYKFRSSLIQRQNYYTRYPKQRSKLMNRSVFKNAITKVENDLATYKSKIGISFSNKKEFDKEWKKLINRAQKVDSRLVKRQGDKAGGVEYSYETAYRFLSEYVHLSMSAINNFWVIDERGSTLVLDKDSRDTDLVLASAYTFYQFFAEKLKQYKLINCSLSRSRKYFRKTWLLDK